MGTRWLQSLQQDVAIVPARRLCPEQSRFWFNYRAWEFRASMDSMRDVQGVSEFCSPHHMGQGLDPIFKDGNDIDVLQTRFRVRAVVELTAQSVDFGFELQYRYYRRLKNWNRVKVHTIRSTME